MSRERLTPSSYAILGLLARRPGSGYEIGALAQQTVHHFWPLTRPHIYSELAKLEELELVSSTEVEQQGVPDKRVYGLTDRGAAELDAWLHDPDPGVQRPRHPLLIKVFLGERLEPDQVRTLLDRYRAEVEARRAEFEAVVGDTSDGRPRATFARLTALFGLRRMEADLAWLAEAEAQLEGDGGS
jgi:DNA-binding PadR family transcriptional regulator